MCCHCQQLYTNIEATPTMLVHCLQTVAYKIQVFQTPSDHDSDYRMDLSYRWQC
jgi:hypothetical protein